MLQVGWIALQKVLPRPQLVIIQDYYRWLEALDTLGSADPAKGGQALRRTAIDEHMARHLYGLYAPIVSRILGRPVQPSYSFMGVYYNEADLEAHRDNHQCEYTLSIQTDLRPSHVRYPFYVCETRVTEEQVKRRPKIIPRTLREWRTENARLERLNCLNYTEIIAEAGDAALIMGRFHSHWRERLAKGAISTSVFLHWVNYEFAGEERSGGKAYSGFARKDVLLPGSPYYKWL